MASETVSRRPPGTRRAGLLDVGTMAPGVIPFGITLGITSTTTGLSAPAALLGAVVVYGGSAQLTTTTMLGLGSGPWAAAWSGVVVHARTMLYGAALEPLFRDQPRWFRLLAPHTIVDQTYLAALPRARYSTTEFRRYWGWLSLFLLVVWVGSVGLGLLVGPLLPALPHAGLIGTSLFVVLLVPRLVDPPTILVGVTSAVVAVPVSRVVPGLGVAVGAGAGLLVALLVDGRGRS